MTPLKLIGVVLGIAGVGMIFSNQLTLAGSKALAGSVALVISSICVAYSNVLVKAHAKNIEPTVIAGGQMFFGLIPLAIIGLAMEGTRELSLDPDGGHLVVLSRDCRFRRRLHFVLLAGAPHRCDEVDADRAGDTSDRGDPGNVGAARRNELAHTGWRRLYYEWDRVPGDSP